jgi:hypothetical protein
MHFFSGERECVGVSSFLKVVGKVGRKEEAGKRLSYSARGPTRSSILGSWHLEPQRVWNDGIHEISGFRPPT